MDSILYQHHITLDDLRSCAQTPVTFLIPAFLRPALARKIRKFKRFGAYIQMLLDKHSDIALEQKLSESSNGARTRYQDGQLDLQPVSCRLPHQSLLELSQVARYLGISRCFLFVILLQKDLQDTANNGKNSSGFFSVFRNIRPPRVIETYERLDADKLLRRRGARIRISPRWIIKELNRHLLGFVQTIKPN